MTNNIEKQFRLYAPNTAKSYETSSDGGLIIEGIASTTNKDLIGDVVLPSAIKSMKNQLTTTTKNLHGDHKYGLDGILGVIKEVVETDDNQLAIRAAIRESYAPSIKEMLDLGVNLGLSIGGHVKDYNTIRDGWEIKDIELFEISLTGMPANWDTYGTITPSRNKEGVVESKCLAGACHMIRKGLKVDIMSENKQDNNDDNEEEKNFLTVDEASNLFNELMVDKQEEIAKQNLEAVRNEMDNIIRETVEEVVNKTPENNNEDNTDNDDAGDEDKIKSIVESAINKSLDSFFEKLNNNRAPNPKVDKAIKNKDTAKKDNNGGVYEDTHKTFTPTEAAQKLFKKNNSNNNLLLQALNQE